MELLLYLGGAFLGSFFVQLLIGCRTAYKVLRFIPLYCFAATLVFAAVALRKNSGLFIGLNVVAAAIWGLIGLCILLGYVLAMLVYKFNR